MDPGSLPIDSFVNIWFVVFVYHWRTLNMLHSFQRVHHRVVGVDGAEGNTKMDFFKGSAILRLTG